MSRTPGSPARGARTQATRILERGEELPPMNLGLAQRNARHFPGTAPHQTLPLRLRRRPRGPARRQNQSSFARACRQADHHLERQRNAELHGTDGAISMEQRRKDTANEVATVYQATLGNVSPTDSIVLHHARIDDILKWTKEHLDAYLASAADVIIDQQRDEPG